MQDITARSLGFAVVAAFVGAALISGKEIWQFFGAYGVLGIVGLLLAAVLIGTFCFLLFTIAKKSGIDDMNRVLLHRDHPFVETALGILQTVFMVGIYAVMVSAAGALTAYICPLPFARHIGAAIVCVLATVITLRGTNSILKVFGFVTPVLVGITAAVTIWSVIQHGIPTVPKTTGNGSPLLHGWFISALNFVSYNFFCVIGILAPLGKRCTKRKTAVLGSIYGSGLLLALMGSILISLYTFPTAAPTELPMLTVAESLASPLKLLYAVLMAIGIFAACITVSAPVPTFLQNTLHLPFSRTILLIAVSIIAFIGSFCGFSTLIDYLYPFFGYVAFAALLLLIRRFFKLRKQDF